MKPGDTLNSNRSEVISLYRDGWSFDNLAARYAVNPSTVRRFLLSAAVTLRPPVRSKALEQRVGRVLEMYRAGMNTQQIADELNVHRNTVTGCLKANKLLRTTPLAKREFFIETDGDKGTLAGLIMGEGSIVTRRTQEVVLSVVNTDPEIIRWLDRWGGRTYWHKPRPRGTKPCGTWRLSRAVDVFHCLNAILPFMFGSKRLLAVRGIEILKARYGLRYSEARSMPGTHGRVGLPATQPDPRPLSRAS